MFSLHSPIHSTFLNLSSFLSLFVPVFFFHKFLMIKRTSFHFFCGFVKI